MIGSLFKHVFGFLSEIASLKSFITAVSVAGAFGVGYALAWNIKDDQLTKYQENQVTLNVKSAQTYADNIKKLNSRIQTLESQSADHSKDAQKTVTKFVDVLVPQIVKDNPESFQCVIPATGMQLIQKSAVELNATRGAVSGH